MNELLPECPSCRNNVPAAQMSRCSQHALMPDNQHIFCHTCVETMFGGSWYRRPFPECPSTLVDFFDLPASLTTLARDIQQVPAADRHRPCRGESPCTFFSLPDGTYVNQQSLNVANGRGEEDPALVALEVELVMRGMAAQCPQCFHLWERAGGCNRVT